MAKIKNGDGFVRGLIDPDSMQSDEMQVLCACDERYLPHAATMLCSLLEHNEVAKIHFFYSAISDRDLDKLKSLVVRYKVEFGYYEVSPDDFKDLRVDKWASPAVYYRFLAPRLLPVGLNKILYLDSDLIVRSSLREFWDTELADKALAAVADYWQDPPSLALLPVGHKLFNSGVLLINLQFWRKHKVPERAIEFVRNNPEKVQFWDQEALNATLVDQWIELPARWNTQNEAQLDQIKTEPAIVHFITADKPWQWSNKHPLKFEYHKYRLKTPWYRYSPEGKPTLSQIFRRLVKGIVRPMIPASLDRKSVV